MRCISRIIHRLWGADREYYRAFRRIFGVTPDNIELYKLALVHRSASVKVEGGESINNERLEFLGDAVLESIVSDYLFIEYPHEPEGFLTKTRSKIVSRQSLNALAERLGLDKLVIYNATGNFAHNPEPIPANLTEICSVVAREHADLGVVVDPDVDRLALVCEDGEMFGEEYTLVACADYILSLQGGGNTVSNLSSSRALRDVTEQHGGSYAAAAVGEVNVVAKMKEVGAVIGGEGNGGVIYPESHYGRDALVGVALFLSLLAHKGCRMSELKASYPQYHISKNKIQLTPEIDVDKVLAIMFNRYTDYNVTDIDGVKIDFPTEWVHLRKSNTEPIIRIYSESRDEDSAERLARGIMNEIGEIVKGN